MSWGYTIGNNVRRTPISSGPFASRETEQPPFCRPNSSLASFAESTTTGSLRSLLNRQRSKTSTLTSNRESRTVSGTRLNAATVGTRIPRRRKLRFLHRGERVSRLFLFSGGVIRWNSPLNFSAAELWAQTRKIRWEDWTCRRRDGNGGGTVLVDIRTPRNWTPFGVLMDWAAEWQRQRFEQAMVKK